ncbi:hypothetical protein [Erwinia phage Pecta]|nr:hypothetical protein [Erwinia phage Pecta]
MAKFEKGDFVSLEIDHWPAAGLKQGVTGVVLETSTYPFVRWDRYNHNLHTSAGMCEDGHGWSVSENVLCAVKLVKLEND